MRNPLFKAVFTLIFALALLGDAGSVTAQMIIVALLCTIYGLMALALVLTVLMRPLDRLVDLVQDCRYGDYRYWPR